MMLLELLVPRGMHGEDELRRLAERLTMKQLMTHAEAIGDVEGAAEVASANPGVVDFLESINHVVVHEVGTWIVDGRAHDPSDPPRYLARVSVPGPWRKNMSAFLIAAITRALCDASSERTPEPRVEVHVIGVPDGSYGLSGGVVHESDLLDMISDAKTDSSVPDPDVLVDPLCGMAAADSVPVLVHEGTTYGFCSAMCRRRFVEKLAVPSPSTQVSDA